MIIHHVLFAYDSYNAISSINSTLRYTPSTVYLYVVGAVCVGSEIRAAWAGVVCMTIYNILERSISYRCACTWKCKLYY